MIEFNSFSKKTSDLFNYALNTAVTHADVFPMLFETYDGRENPTQAETEVTTEFCRYCLQNQSIPDGWERHFAFILNSVAYLWSDMLDDQEENIALLRRMATIFDQL